jgi:hypothetical protein
MDIIETLNPAAFTEYLKKFGNTICGRHPIGVLLQVKHSIYLLKGIYHSTCKLTLCKSFSFLPQCTYSLTNLYVKYRVTKGTQQSKTYLHIVVYYFKNCSYWQPPWWIHSCHHY